MKWYNSLISKITIVFVIALIGIGAIFFSIKSHTMFNEIHNIQRYTRALVGAKGSVDFDTLKSAGYILVKDDKLKDRILKDKTSDFMQQRMKNFANKRSIKIKTVPFHGDIYTIINNKIVFKAPYEKKFYLTTIFPIVAFVLILILYITIIKSILPLYDLRKKVIEFAEGNYNINCKSDKKDEIAILANEFDKSVKKIKKLRDSRQLFLRNIMHELKTPITKGKLACEMIEESIYQTTLKNAFKRQENLIEEFARIEKLNANELELKKEKYSLQDIIDFSLDLINHEKEKVDLKIAPMSLMVDFELFATALKNLIDNGINYSYNKKVEVISTKDTIIIRNEAPPLEFSLEKYAQPYFLEGKKQKSSRGLGFGLFITINLIKLHGMKLEYKHIDGINNFIIQTNPS
ncbi:ArsS family sensor histidine kinase [Sulfurospirillum sp. 1307]